MGTENFETSKNLIDKICYFIRNDLTELSHIGVLVPYPGSPLWNSPEKYGYALIATAEEYKQRDLRRLKMEG